MQGRPNASVIATRSTNLRVDVFIVEQQCFAPELDGRDDEPDTWHCWIEEGGEVIAYLRILAEPDGSRIGRVATTPAARG